MATKMVVREAKIVFTGRRGKTAPQINSAWDAWNLCKDLANETQEHFVVLCLDTHLRVTSRQTVALGTVDCVEVHPRDVFRAAIMQNSKAVVILHNHPSGDPEPSENDMLMTKRLLEAGEIIGIEVHDHIVIGHRRFVSIRNSIEAEAQRRAKCGMGTEEYLRQILSQIPGMQ